MRRERARVRACVRVHISVSLMLCGLTDLFKCDEKCRCMLHTYMRARLRLHIDVHRVHMHLQRGNTCTNHSRGGGQGGGRCQHHNIIVRSIVTQLAFVHQIVKSDRLIARLHASRPLMTLFCFSLRMSCLPACSDHVNIKNKK